MSSLSAPQRVGIATTLQNLDNLNCDLYRQDPILAIKLTQYRPTILAHLKWDPMEEAADKGRVTRSKTPSTLIPKKLFKALQELITFVGENYGCTRSTTWFNAEWVEKLEEVLKKLEQDEQTQEAADETNDQLAGVLGMFTQFQISQNDQNPQGGTGNGTPNPKIDTTTTATTATTIEPSPSLPPSESAPQQQQQELSADNKKKESKGKKGQNATPTTTSTTTTQPSTLLPPPKSEPQQQQQRLSADNKKKGGKSKKGQNATTTSTTTTTTTNSTTSTTPATSTTTSPTKNASEKRGRYTHTMGSVINGDLNTQPKIIKTAEVVTTIGKNKDTGLAVQAAGLNGAKYFENGGVRSKHMVVIATKKGQVGTDTHNLELLTKFLKNHPLLSKYYKSDVHPQVVEAIRDAFIVEISIPKKNTKKWCYKPLLMMVMRHIIRNLCFAKKYCNMSEMRKNNKFSNNKFLQTISKTAEKLVGDIAEVVGKDGFTNPKHSDSNNLELVATMIDTWEEMVKMFYMENHGCAYFFAPTKEQLRTAKGRVTTMLATGYQGHQYSFLKSNFFRVRAEKWTQYKYKKDNKEEEKDKEAQVQTPPVVSQENLGQNGPNFAPNDDDKNDDESGGGDK